MQRHVPCVLLVLLRCCSRVGQFPMQTCSLLDLDVHSCVTNHSFLQNQSHHWHHQKYTGKHQPGKKQNKKKNRTEEKKRETAKISEGCVQENGEMHPTQKKKTKKIIFKTRHTNVVVCPSRPSQESSASLSTMLPSRRRKGKQEKKENKNSSVEQ